MAGLAFLAGDRICRDGHAFVITGRGPGGTVAVQGEDGRGYHFRAEDLEKEFTAGTLEFVRHSSSLGADFASLDEDTQREIRRRYQYVREAVRLPSRTPETLGPLIKTVVQSSGDCSPPSWTTVYRWCRDFTRAEGDVIALAPVHHRKGNRNCRLADSVEEFINLGIKDVYLTPERGTIRRTHRTIERRIMQANRVRAPDDQLATPSYNAVRDRVNKLDAYVCDVARWGKRIAAQRFRSFGRAKKATRPLQYVEVDHTQLDLFVLDDETGVPLGRPWLTAVIDRYSRYFLGFCLSFEGPNWLSVAQALEHAILPKTQDNEEFASGPASWSACGIPEVLVVDNGKEFLSKEFEDACLQLGVEIEYSPVRKPWFKPIVERHFRTINQRLLYQFKGRTFESLKERADYNSVKNAVIEFATLRKVFFLWVVNVYPYSAHRGISDTPANLWQKGIIKGTSNNSASTVRS